MKHFPKATLINAAAIFIGGMIGYFFQEVLSQGSKNILFQAIGLGTILIGGKMAFKLPEGYMLAFMFSLILGGLLGEAMQLESVIVKLSDSLKAAVRAEDSMFTQGLITAFILFCIGSMTIVGALEEGLRGNRELIYIKSMLDGFSAIALTATFGIGVIFSIIPLLLFQGGITVGAPLLNRVLTTQMIDTLTAVGGVMIIGISIELLELGELNLENLLPALFMALILSRGLQSYKERTVAS